MVTKRALHPTAHKDPTQNLHLRLTGDLPVPSSSPPSFAFPRSQPLAQKSRPIPKKYPAKAHCQTVSSLINKNALPSSSPSPPGLIYLPSACTTYPPYSDQPHPFRQLRHFYYLSGCPLADSHLTYDINRDKLTLYIPPLDPREVLWTGMPLLPEECLEKFDVDEVRYSNLLRGDLDAWVVGCDDGSGGVIYCLDKQSLPPHPAGAEEHGLDVDMLAECGWGWTGLRGVVVDTEKLRGAIDNARVYKDEFEIGLLRKAIDVTRKGHISVMGLLRKNMHHTHSSSSHHSHHSSLTEADLEGIYRSSCISSHAKNQAYDPIVCSGRSAATLHYTANNAPLKGKQLLLIDAGAEWDCYAADITRTYPINGKWTKEAKEIYDIVDRMQRECISKTVAGMSWRETHFLAARIAVEGLVELGVFKSKEKGNGVEMEKEQLVQEIFKAGTWRAFFPHGLGHMLGLETHDVEGTPDDKSGYDPHLFSSSSISTPRLPRHLPSAPQPPSPDNATTLVNRVLKPNMVLTVEPGVYFCEWIIKPYLSNPKHCGYIDAKVLDKYWDVGGVRIEDVVLVKEEGKGNEVLSKNIPRGW